MSDDTDATRDWARAQVGKPYDRRMRLPDGRLVEVAPRVCDCGCHDVPATAAHIGPCVCTRDWYQQRPPRSKDS
jgi:hypothetical protein